MLPPRRDLRLDLSRRGFLLGGLGAAAGLAGCTLVDPRPDGTPRTSDGPVPSPRPSRSPSPGPTPGFPAAADAARREQAMADLYAALLRGHWAEDLDRTQRLRLRSIGGAHDRHAAALRTPEPTARLDGPVPARDPEAGGVLRGRSARQVLALAVRRERALAARHRQAAITATGLAAVLWGSLATASGSYARTVAEKGPAVAPTDAAAPLPVLSDVEAMQELVRQLHAMVYGYQLALGQLPAPSSRHTRARRALAAVRGLRDRTAAALTRRSAAVPVAEAAYVPSVQPRDATTAGTLARQIETALLPFLGLWLAAAAAPVDREWALASLAAAEARAAAWGAAPAVWPGWPG